MNDTNDSLNDLQHEILNTLGPKIKNEDDKDMLITVLMCTIGNDPTAKKIVDYIRKNPDVSIEDVNFRLTDFLPPLEIVDDEDYEDEDDED